MLFYIVVAAFYWRLPSTSLAGFLSYQFIGMTTQHYPTIALVHALCAVPHAVCILAMLSGSLVRRSLAFGFPLKFPVSHTASRRSSSVQHLARVAARSIRLADNVFGSQGLFGVNGKHYGAILVARELFETALQTAQGYKMSKLLPRVALNLMYVALIVGNCCVTAIVRVLFSKSNARAVLQPRVRLRARSGRVRGHHRRHRELLRERL